MTVRAQSATHRMPARFIPSAILGSAAPVAGLSLAAVFATQGERNWLALLAGAFAAGRLCMPVYQYFSVAYRLTGEGIRYSTGLLLRRTRFARWETIGTLEVSVPWYFRPAGLASVAILQSGEESGRISIPAVSRADAAQFVLRHGQHRAERRITHDDGAPADVGSVVFRATAADLAIASCVYGKFATLGAAIAASALDSLNSLGLGKMIPAVLPSGSLGVALVSIFAALAIMAAGVAATVVRHFDLRTIDMGETLEIHQGLMSTQRRILDAKHVTGIELQRNLVEAVLGRSRLTALSLDTNLGLGTNLVLPSLRDALVEDIVDRTFDHRLGESAWAGIDRRRLVGRLVGTAAVAALVITAVTSSSMALGLPLGVSLGAALVAALLVRGAGRVLSGRLRATDSAAIVDTVFLSHKRTVLALDSVHVVSSVELRRRIWLVTLHHYAGMARALRAVAVSPDQLRKVTGS